MNLFIVFLENNINLVGGSIERSFTFDCLLSIKQAEKWNFLIIPVSPGTAPLNLFIFSLLKIPPYLLLFKESLSKLFVVLCRIIIVYLWI